MVPVLIREQESGSSILTSREEALPGFSGGHRRDHGQLDGLALESWYVWLSRFAFLRGTLEVRKSTYYRPIGLRHSMDIPDDKWPWTWTWTWTFAGTWTSAWVSIFDYH